MFGSRKMEKVTLNAVSAGRDRHRRRFFVPNTSWHQNYLVVMSILTFITTATLAIGLYTLPEESTNRPLKIVSLVVLIATAFIALAGVAGALSRQKDLIMIFMFGSICAIIFDMVGIALAVIVTGGNLFLLVGFVFLAVLHGSVVFSGMALSGF